MPAFLIRGLKRIGILLVAYTLCRVLFLFWNWSLYSMLPFGEWAPAFFYGLRFDLSAIVMTNAVLILLWMFPARIFKGPWVSRLELVLFFVINWIAIGSSVVDAEFVKFIGKRTSYDMLLIQQDLRQQGLNVIAGYWYFCLGLSLLIGLIVWLSPKMQGLTEPPTWLGKFAWRFLAIGAAVTAVRGGYQFKPLHPMHAYYGAKQELGLLTLNTPFNVIRTKPHSEIERQRFFSSDREAVEHLQTMTKLTRPPLALAKKFNVVQIIVESLATEFMGVANNYSAYTPFLDSLAKDSFYFKYNFANGRRSIEAVPAVVCGIPSIMAEPVITSEFSNNRFDCLPHILNRAGYETHFLHGAHNGSMHFDTFSNIAGFKNFVGLNEFPKGDPTAFDEYWGVLDEPMLQHAVTTLDKANGPALVTVFTLSSHFPYYIPPQHRGKFPKGELEIHETIGYVDYAIQKFFETARTRPWFNNTIFVITGDHTQKVHHKEYLTMLGGYRVPLYFYVPGLKGKLAPPDPNRITQHIDILPSITDLLGLDHKDRLLVGQSVFDAGHEGRAYNFSSPRYWYLDSQVYLNMNRDGTAASVEKHMGRAELTTGQVEKALVDRAILNMKSIVHYLNEGLLRNNLYGWRSSP